MFVPIARLYVLRNFTRYLALSLFVFTSLLVLLNFVQIVDHGALAGFSFYFLSAGILCLLPNIIGSSLPLAFLLATLLSLGQLSQDGEIVALRAGGFSFYQILSWVFGAAVFCSLLLLFLNNWAGPRALRRSTDYTRLMIERVTKIELKPRTFQQLSDWVLYAREVNNLSGSMRGVIMLRRLNRSGAPAFVTKLNASSGHYSMSRGRGLEIELSDGQFSQTDCRDEDKLLYGRFDSYRTMLPFFSGDGKERDLNHRELSTPDIFARLKAGLPNPLVESKYRIEAASRFALALAPLAFFLIGAPLGVALDKRGRSAGFALSLLIIFFYYGFTISGMVLARKYQALFPWAVFAPSVLTILTGLWLWKKRLHAR